jgi:integrase
MSETTTLLGTEIATTQMPIESLGDLLVALHALGDGGQVPMLRSTAVKLEEFLGKPSSEITLQIMEDCREDFSDFLTARKYERNSVRSYLNYLRILVCKTKELGYTAVRPIAPAWEELLLEARLLNCGAICKYFAMSGMAPGSVAEIDLCAWIQKRVERGFGYHTAYSQVSRLRRILTAAGYGVHLDGSKIDKGNYGIPVSEFPDKLRSEVETLLKWKQAEFAPGRQKGGKLRAVSAKNLRQTFTSLVGFACNIAMIKPECLLDLMKEDFLTQFIEWSLTERDVSARSLKKSLGSLHGAVRYHPAYKAEDLTWLPPLIASLSLEPESAIQERKNLKYLPYETVATIPAKIRAGRAQAAKISRKELAVQVRDELLIQWLVTLAWRQRNIRECRIEGTKPNLFKTKLPKISSVNKPFWVRAAEAENPEATFWQFKFTADETKSGRPVHCVLPKKLADLVDEYLLDYRDELVVDTDPGTLFLNESGRPLNIGRLNNIVSEQTLRHGGRVVTPHLFRDILAYAWLEKKPEDYLTVSKLLWHKNIGVTINNYGQRFNESTALCRMEEVFG